MTRRYWDRQPFVPFEVTQYDLVSSCVSRAHELQERLFGVDLRNGMTASAISVTPLGPLSLMAWQDFILSSDRHRLAIVAKEAQHNRPISAAIHHNEFS